MTKDLFDSLTFDFSDVTEFGVILKPGRYLAEVTSWKARMKEETGNVVFDIDFEIVQGEYAKQGLRYFHTVTSKDYSRTYLLQLFTALGLIQDGDRQGDKEFKANLVFGNKDDSGRREVTHIVVGGVKRPVIGARGILVVNNNIDDVTGEKKNWVSKIDKVNKGADAPGSTDAQTLLF